MTSNNVSTSLIEPRPALSQLAPFNEQRFGFCMAYLAATKRQALSQIYAVKFNVLIDLFHILDCGKPVIGGSVAAWELGPVITQAYHLWGQWRFAYDSTGRQPPGFHVVGRSKGKMLLRASESVDLNEFSPMEIRAMERAWDEIGHLKFPALRHYTHNPQTFLGAAYVAADHGNQLMDWDQIIAKWDEERNEDHSAIRALIRL